MGRTVVGGSVVMILSALCAVSSPVAAAVPIQLTHVSMVNAHAGWGTTIDTVLWTSDGGATWRTRLTFPREPGMSEGGNGFLFASVGATTAWAVAPVGKKLYTYRTGDGGASWIHFSQSFRPPAGGPVAPQLVFSDAEHGWLLVHGGAGSGSVNHAIYRTTNSGKSWQRIEFQNTGGSSSKGALPACNNSAGNISFAGSATGWATGICGTFPGSKGVYRSVNGGVSWVSTHVTNVVEQLKYFNPGQVIVTGRTSELVPVSVAKPSEFVLYRSSDRGRDWAPSSPLKLKCSGSVGPVYLYAPFSARTSWVSLGAGGSKGCGNKLTLWRTENGGSSWTQLATKLPLSQVIQIDFSTENDGFAVTIYGALQVTKDGGMHWRSVTPEE